MCLSMLSRLILNSWTHVWSSCLSLESSCGFRLVPLSLAPHSIQHRAIPNLYIDSVLSLFLDWVTEMEYV